MFTKTDNADSEQGFHIGDYIVHGCCKLCAAERCTISRKVESCWFSVYHAILSSCWNYYQMLLLSLRIIIDQTLFYLTADNYVTHLTPFKPAFYSLQLAITRPHSIRVAEPKYCADSSDGTNYQIIPTLTVLRS